MLPKIDPAAIARHPRTRRWGLRFLAFMAVAGILGFLVVPPLLKSMLIDRLATALRRDVAIDAIRFNPYTLTLEVAGLSVRERGDGKAGDELFGFDRLTVNAELASLAVAGIVVKEVRLSGPRVNLLRLADGRYNISDLLAASGGEKREEQGGEKVGNSSGLPRFSVSNIRIEGGRLVFDDRAEGVRHEISDIALAVPFISTLSYYADTDVEPHFSATVNGAPLTLQGRSRPFADAHESELTLDIDQLPIAKYLAYSPVELPLRVLSGTLAGDLRLRFLQAKGQAPALTLAGRLALADLAVEESGGAPLLALKRLDLTLGEADLVSQAIGIERIAIEAPTVDVRIGKQGGINWLELLPAAGDRSAAGRRKAAPQKNGGTTLQWRLEALTIVGGSVNLLDRSQAVEQTVALRGLNVEVHDYDSNGARPLRFSADGQIDAGEQLQIARIAVKDGQADLAKRELVIGEMRLADGRARIVRQRDGTLQWLRPPAPRPAPDDGSKPWQVSLTRAQIDGQTLQFDDRSLTTPATQTLEIATLTATDVSTRADAEAKLDLRLRINRKGELAAAGTLKPMLPQGELRLTARDIELLPLQPYFGERLDLTVTRGQIAADGSLSIAPGAAGPAFGYRGNLTVGNFHSVDKANAADLLKWKSFHFGGLDVTSAPLAVTIGEVALSDFYARLILSAEGRLNLMQVARRETAAPAAGGTETATGDRAGGEVSSPPAPATQAAAMATATASTAPPAPKAAVVPVKIGKVTLQGGNINFTDNFVKPNYSANLTQIGGRVNGLSSAEGSVADLELRGSYDGQAPVNITARLNPFAARSYLDLDAEVKGVDMSGLSTYSGKYAGYAIERGKLSLFLKYRVDNGKLTADNRLFLDQLAFGDEIDSPGATRLPVRLAVALLKNRRGEIDINLPIAGSLDDPQFSVGGIVVKMILNLFAKAITSPFALIGSLFGGGEELAWVEFDYGYASLTPKMKERLQSIAKMLDDRPAIRIEIAGRSDPERDREGLKRALMERRIKAQRLAELVKEGSETGSVDDIAIPAKDYAKYLERAYRAEKFPKPRNLVGFVKELPVEEMEKLMMANMKADDEALRDLAVRRAAAVGAWLGGDGKVAAERVFLLQPHLSAKEGPQNDKASEARADFMLK